MGFPYFDMEFNTRFPYSEMVLDALFPRISAISTTLILISVFLKWNQAISNAWTPFSRLRKLRKCAEIMRKVPYQNKEIIIYFISKRKSHFKLQKVLFKRGLERNSKNQKVLRIWRRKRWWDYFLQKNNAKKRLFF